MNITEDQVKMLVQEYIGYAYCPESQNEARSQEFFSGGIIFELWQQLQAIPLKVSWIPRKEEIRNPFTNKAVSIRYVVFNILRRSEENATLNGRAIVTSIDIATVIKVMANEIIQTSHQGAAS